MERVRGWGSGLAAVSLCFGPTLLRCKGSGCGTVGRAASSDTRGLRFKSSQIIVEHLISADSLEKTKNKEEEAGQGR